MYRHQEHGGDVDALDVDDLHRVDGGDGEGSGLLVPVMEFVEVLVQDGPVIDPVDPVRGVVL